MGSNNNPGNDNNQKQGSDGGVQDRSSEQQIEKKAAETKMSDHSFDLMKEGSPQAKGKDTASCLPDCGIDMGDNKKDAGDNREASQLAHAGDRGSDRREGEGRKGRHLENGRTSAEVSEDGNEVSSRVGDNEVRHNRRDHSSEVRHGNDRIGMRGHRDRDGLRRDSEQPENQGNVQANEDGDRAVSDENTTVEQDRDGDITFHDRHHGRHHGHGRGHGHGDGERDEQNPGDTQSQTPGDSSTQTQQNPDAAATNPENGDQTNERGDGDGKHHDRDMGDFILRRGEDRHGPRHLVVDGQDIGVLDKNMSAEDLQKAGLTRVDDNTYRMENGQTFEVNENGRVKFGSRDCDGNENHIEMGENDGNGQPVVKQDGITISNLPEGGTQVVTGPDGERFTQKDGEFHAFDNEGNDLQAFIYDTGDFTGLDLSFDADDPFFSMGGGFSDAPMFGQAGYDASTVYGEDARSPEAPAEHSSEATSANQAASAAAINITNLSGTVSASDIAAAFGAAGNCLTVGNQLYGEYLETGSEQARALFGDCMSMHANVVSKTADAQPMAVQNQVLDRFGIRGSLMGEVGTDVAQRFQNLNPYKVAQWLSEEVKRGGMIDSSRLANIA